MKTRVLMLCYLLTACGAVDTRTGPATQKETPDVLIIGDSISIGYTPYVTEALKGEANVVHNSGNAQHTGVGLQHLDEWLGDTDWEVIHFNWGLWDLCYRNPDSPNPGHRDKVNGTLTFTPEEYGRNLEQLVERLEKTGARLIWASTTVVPEGEHGRIAGDEVRYNEVAAVIMKNHGIPTDDLHALTRTFGPEMFVRPGDVHYTSEGYERLGAQVTRSIESALRMQQAE